METNPSIGADPEFFIVITGKDKNKKLKVKEIISADRILPGKDDKLRFYRGEGFFDGVQAEINPTYSICREIFGENIQYIMKDIYDIAKNRLNRQYNINFYPTPSIEVDISKLKKHNADNECFRFGCAPDFNIYSSKRIKYPNGRKFNIRFSGGHIHLGMSDLDYQKYFKDPTNMLKLIYLLDIIPGIISVAVAPYEEEKVRRKWYGKAGSYRIQPHGIEYRTLSSFWLVSPPLMSLFTGLSRDAFTLAFYGEYENILKIMEKYRYTQNNVRTIIDNHDSISARKFYYTVIKDIYNTYKITNSPLCHRYERDILELFIENGYKTYFNPLKTLHYWSIKKPYMYMSDSIFYFGWKKYSSNFEKYNKRK